MQLDSRLQKSRHGIYYLRIQRHGLDRRWSLRTRDPLVAAIHAHELSVTLLRMNNVPTKPFSGFTLKADGDKYELTTEDNDSDRADGTAAFLLAQKQRLDRLEEMRTQISAIDLAEAQSKINALELTLAQSSSQSVAVNNKKTITIATAIIEYQTFLDKSKIAVKSKKMALSVLNNLKLLLGAGFDMHSLTDDVIENVWLADRLKSVAETTAKRDLSFIRGFVEWSFKSKYTPAELTFAVVATGEHYEYFNRADLKLIFDNLPAYAENAWQFWVPIIGLYTGARIAEIAGLRTEYVSERSELNVLRLAGTKTVASDREIPIPYDLIRLGFLDYVQYRRKHKFEMLFDITHSVQNGAGAQASKFFTAYKKEIGLTHRLKVFHSFRATIIDHLKQAGVGFEARCQYAGHDDGGGVHNKVYARNEISLLGMQNAVVDKIDWRVYCGWTPNFLLLSAKANDFIVKT